jgi:phosphatidylserine decarboxylase
MPCDGRLRRMVHVPGTLFSVNPATVQGVPGLFARNERVVCVFDMPWGGGGEVRPFALVLVGATIVGSMATTWHGVVNPPRPGGVRVWTYEGAAARRMGRGEEMGRFLLGSTVVLLWPRDTIRFQPDWTPGRAVRMGEAMAHFTR